MMNMKSQRRQRRRAATATAAADGVGLRVVLAAAQWVGRGSVRAVWSAGGGVGLHALALNADWTARRGLESHTRVWRLGFVLTGGGAR